MNVYPFATSGAESVNVSGAPDFTNVFTCLNMRLVLLMLSNGTSLFFFSCCDVRCNFRVKTIFSSSLTLFVGIHVLFMF